MHKPHVKIHTQHTFVVKIIEFPYVSARPANGPIGAKYLLRGPHFRRGRRQSTVTTAVDSLRTIWTIPRATSSTRWIVYGWVDACVHTHKRTHYTPTLTMAQSTVTTAVDSLRTIWTIPRATSSARWIVYGWVSACVHTHAQTHYTHPRSQWRNPPSPPHAHTHTHAHAHTRPHAHGHGWGGGSLPAPPFNPFLSSLTQPTYSSRCVRHHDWSDGGLLLAKCIVSFLAKSNTHAALTWAWAGLKPFFLCFIDIFCK